MENTMLLETTALIGLRLVLFFACRKYLLRSLYSDLQTLSTEPASDPLNPLTTSIGSGIELDALPTPTTQTKSSKAFSTDPTFFHSIVARTLFSLSFAESCLMFLLLMFQAMNIFSPRARLANWRISLAFSMATILVLVPLCLTLILAIGVNPSGGQRRRFIWPRVALSLIPVGLFLFALSQIPLPAALSSSDTMSAALSRLVVLGTLILGLLSGFGAINNSWSFIPILARPRSEPTDQDISSAEYALQSIRNDLRDRTREAEQRGGTQPEGSWLGRVVPNFRGGDGRLRELQGLTALEYQMSRNLDALRSRRDTAKYSRTMKGRVFNFCGRIFALYCIARIISSVVNVLFPGRRSSSTTTYPDLITDVLAQTLSLVSPGYIKFEDIALFSRQLSLVLVGIIILTNIRLVLRGVTRALRVTSRNLGASLMVLLLAQLMGIYLLSTIVQLRTSFPPPPPKPDEDTTVMNLFSTIPEFEVFGSLFDWSFLFAAGASAFWKWGAEKVNGVGDI